MKNYGKTAVRAVELIHTNQVATTSDAWTRAAVEIFGSTSTRHRKACPRSTFLGLCEEGLIKGVSETHISKRLRNQTNKGHAIDAINLLRDNPFLFSNPRELWKLLMNGDPKSHNFQMDVVTALWNHELIVPQLVTV